eukprot:TRINITY_DN22256_c0_g1_i1.p1 TRINITY_DN22256_c0_g1~~TRINITY_DN22256_c0_g1_i1.p1  ORF type:complete len:297 (+),score=52.94 TRINITY_DN22256_c0_g1_i1:86-892(+)
MSAMHKLDQPSDSPFMTGLLARNVSWVKQRTTERADCFSCLSKGQAPKVLWFGCSDSRVPAELVGGFAAGELFVHRNVANLIVATDMSMLSVLQYAVEVLEVDHIVVCGHTGCGGCKAAMQQQDLGLIENWLRNIRDVARLHDADLRRIPEASRLDALIEFNVLEQARNIFKTGIFQAARKRTNGYPQLHGVVYELETGHLRPVPLGLGSFVHGFGHVYKLIADASTTGEDKEDLGMSFGSVPHDSVRGLEADIADITPELPVAAEAH